MELFTDDRRIGILAVDGGIQRVIDCQILSRKQNGLAEGQRAVIGIDRVIRRIDDRTDVIFSGFSKFLITAFKSHDLFGIVILRKAKHEKKICLNVSESHCYHHDSELFAWYHFDDGGCNKRIQSDGRKIPDALFTALFLLLQGEDADFMAALRQSLSQVDRGCDHTVDGG